MKTFTIDSENNITVFASMQQAKTSDQTDAALFTTQEELNKLADGWPGGRLVEIWNSLPGATPVKKFTDRKTAIARIWKAIQSLQPAPEAEEKAAPARDVATGRAAKSKATSKRPRGTRKPPRRSRGRVRAARRPQSSNSSASRTALR